MAAPSESPASTWGPLPRDVWAIICAHLPYRASLRFRRVNSSFAKFPESTARTLPDFTHRPFREIVFKRIFNRDQYSQETWAGGLEWREVERPWLLTLIWKDWISSAFPPVDEVASSLELIDLRLCGNVVTEPFLGNEQNAEEYSDTGTLRKEMQLVVNERMICDVNGRVLLVLPPESEPAIAAARHDMGIGGVMLCALGAGDVVLRLY